MLILFLCFYEIRAFSFFSSSSLSRNRTRISRARARDESQSKTMTKRTKPKKQTHVQQKTVSLKFKTAEEIEDTHFDRATDLVLTECDAPKRLPAGLENMRKIALRTCDRVPEMSDDTIRRLKDVDFTCVKDGVVEFLDRARRLGARFERLRLEDVDCSDVLPYAEHTTLNNVFKERVCVDARRVIVACNTPKRIECARGCVVFDARSCGTLREVRIHAEDDMQDFKVERCHRLKRVYGMRSCKRFSATSCDRLLCVFGVKKIDTALIYMCFPFQFDDDTDIRQLKMSWMRGWFSIPLGSKSLSSVRFAEEDLPSRWALHLDEEGDGYEKRTHIIPLGFLHLENVVLHSLYTENGYIKPKETHFDLEEYSSASRDVIALAALSEMFEDVPMDAFKLIHAALYRQVVFAIS